MGAVSIGMNIMTVAVTMAIILRADVFQLVHAPALRATLDRAITRRCQPDHHVRVGGASRAAQVLLVAKGFDRNGIREGAYVLQLLALLGHPAGCMAV